MSASFTNCKAWWQVLLLCICLPFNGLGNGLSPLPSYRFQSITVNDNLSHSDVNCVLQDSLGYIWIGTNNGLNRFDGYRVETFKYNLEDQRSIPGNRIKHMQIDQLGQIWITIENKGLYRFFPKEMEFRHVPLPTLGVSILGMTLSREGDIWVNKGSKGLCRVSVCKEGDVKEIKTYSFRDIGLSKTAVSLDFLQKGEKGVYVMADDNSLYFFAEEVEEFVPIWSTKDWADFGGWQINSLMEDGRDLWLATGQGVVRLRPNAVKGGYNSHLFQAKEPPYGIGQIYKDFDDQIWLGTTYGLHILTKAAEQGEGSITKGALQKVHFTGTAFQSDRVTHLFQDRFGVLWVGSTGGINYTSLKNKAFRYLRGIKPGETRHRNIASVFKAGDGKIWTGSSQGLFTYDPITGSSREYVLGTGAANLKGRYVVFIQEDHRGDIWLGFKGGTLNRVHDQDGELRFEAWPRVGKNGVVLGRNLMQSTEDEKGRLWITTHSDGLFMLDKDRENYTHIIHDPTNTNSLSTNNLTAIYADPKDGSMWVSTRDGGVNHLQEDEQGQWRFEHFKHDPEDAQSLSSNHTWQVHRTVRGELWVATLGGGLNRVIESEDIRFERYTMSNGLVDNDIECLAEDDQGFLWLAGKGLSRFDPQNGRIQFFDYQDGLQSNSFKIGAVHKDDQGWLYFGGINGLNYFEPQSITKDELVPEVYITGLQVNSEPIKVGDEVKGRTLLTQSLFDQPEIRLKANENDFTIHFVGLQLASALKNQYKFKLEGVNGSWVETRYPNLSANYSNVSPGDYTFKVMASNGDGVWNQKVTQLSVYVASPWYATPWAFIIYGLLGLFGLFLFRRVTERQLSLKNELILAEKEQELNQYKLSFFTNISHELRSPLTLIRGPLEELLLHSKVRKETKVKLRIIQNSSNRLLNLMNQLLDFRKVETGNMRLQAAKGNFVKFCEELFLIFSQSASEKNIQFRFETPTNNVPLTYDRDKMETVLMNLLSNAYKFTPENGCITVRLRLRGKEDKSAVFGEKGELKDNYLLIEVIDNGTGMNTSDIKKVFDPYYQVKNQDTLHTTGTGIGLSLVKGMIDLHQGTVEVKSEKGRGTTFQLKIPCGEAHLSAEQLIPDFKNSEYLGHYLPEENRGLVATDVPQDNYLKVISDRSRKYKVAIVEDNMALRTYLRQVLEEDFVICEAANGREALSMILENPPDLIVSDVMMPVMDGIRFCKAIKETELVAHLPIILLTARTSKVYELEGLEMGAESYITKPFNVQMLKSRIYTILKNRQYLREFYRKQLFFEPVKENQLSPEEKLVHQAIEIVEAHLEDATFNVQRLAEMLHQSQSSLYRKIKAVTGKSLVEFVRDVRLRKAAEMIRAGDLTITEIAYKVGFSSIKYFRQCFKNLYEMTPSAFGQLKEVPKQAKGIVQPIRSVGS